ALHYIDTSYLAPFYLPEAKSEAVEKELLKLPRDSIVISPLVRAEFASLLSRKFRMKEMDEADARRVMTALDRHLRTEAIRMVAMGVQDFQQATEWIMTMMHPLRAPDALHLSVAARQDAVFCTLDQRLARAAKWIGLKTRR
ncbi:MAG: type II toxin-antitoxin system VapC family toxin, partial [Proteobacteria bacterium]|nr:type II toxin-antitoxin system VapC family toxin [Pseudomonadota bacterium]